jgi:hypothetical protein
MQHKLLRIMCYQGVAAVAEWIVFIANAHWRWRVKLHRHSAYLVKSWRVSTPMIAALVIAPLFTCSLIFISEMIHLECALYDEIQL